MILLTLLSQYSKLQPLDALILGFTKQRVIIRIKSSTKLKLRIKIINWCDQRVIMLICYAPYGIISPFFRKSPNPSPSLALGMSVSISVSLCNSCINPLYCWKIRAVRVRAINLLTRILPGWNTRKQIQKEEYSKFFVTRYLNRPTHCEALVLNNWKEKL